MKVWFIDRPCCHYEEDVVQIAKDNNLVLVNSSLSGVVNAKPEVVEQSPPALTVKAEYQ